MRPLHATRSARRSVFMMLSIVAGLMTSRVASADAAFDYTLHCQGCHLEDGRGTAPDVPALRDTLGKLVAQPGGREYITRVPGASQAPISDARLAAVLNWVLQAFNAKTLPSGFAPYTAEEIARGRRQVLVDPKRRRAEIVAAAREDALP